MSRVKRSPNSRRRRRKILDMAKGFRAGSSKQYRIAKARVQKALSYAYRDRRAKKGDFRTLWITRIGIASQQNGLSYSRLIAGLKKAQIGLDRKILSDLAVRSPALFSTIVAKAKSSLGQSAPATQ